MLFECRKPFNVTPFELDEYLGKGWYRSVQNIFTSDFEYFDYRKYKVWWIRFAVKKLKYSREAKSIFNRNKQFTISYGNAAVNSERAALYEKYKTTIEFNQQYLLEDLLYEDGVENVYPSETIELRDGARLIAVGYYDKGETSIAGIINCYDPEYKSFSLGKYLLLLQIERVVALRKLYYYPGYIVEGYPKFDYKLFPCQQSVEYYDHDKDAWLKLDTKEYLQSGFILA